MLCFGSVTGILLGYDAIASRVSDEGRLVSCVHSWCYAGIQAGMLLGFTFCFVFCLISASVPFSY